MSISNISPALNAYRQIESITKPESNQQVQPTNLEGTDKKSGNFGQMLSSAIKEVNGLQQDANQQVQGLVLGRHANTHEAMIALEKADVAFQLMNSVRSKIVRAYEEVMRAQL